MNDFLNRISRGFNRRWKHAWQNYRLDRLSGQILKAEAISRHQETQKPVIFFNASTRLSGMSLNAGFSLIASWALRIQGVPVEYFVCQHGMTHCILGTDRETPTRTPPCKECVAQSRHTYRHSSVHWSQFKADPDLDCIIEELALPELMRLTYRGMPLGQLALPSLRWILRRHHLNDDERTRYLFRQYILSAWSIAEQFRQMLASVQPQAVVLFNGMFYPEAAARWVTSHYSPETRVISHEVGLRPYSGFFTTGEATAYPLDLPEDFELDESQSARLDEYLSQRFRGNFSMAGIRFWPEMEPIDPTFWEEAKQFKQVVPVFTNVIFDTSQDHANVVFEDMFEWLDALKEAIRSHPDTLFVIRAHPDESRPGKRSQESVSDWVKKTGLDQWKNVRFIPPEEYFSSYELIERSKFVLIYNSTIGLEATLLGTAVLSAGKARFTQIPTVFFPQSKEEYLGTLASFLENTEIDVPAAFRQNARRFLYVQVFQSSLPFDRFLEEDGVWKGYVAVKPFSLDELQPGRSETVQVLLDGILRGGTFLLDA